MNRLTGSLVDSPIGRQPIDVEGSPVGVARLDPDLSYVGVGLLLQDYINSGRPEAWAQIRTKIDYTYENLSGALGTLEAETGFATEIRTRIGAGQKLLLKPNLVAINNINPQTHGPDAGGTTCTEWPFVAALMRWFHDRLGITYHQMALGEAATTMSTVARTNTLLNPAGTTLTTEATIEGRSGDFYGGWGFYFARQYLAETHDPSHTDDPWQGYAESVAGTYVPPGEAPNKLMVYDLNRICDDESKGRDVAVPDGVNFRTITLHKVVAGGDPLDAADRAAYPGCVLLNVPKLKVHNMALFTNVIKNLGIGLYPMEAATGGACQWKYAMPPGPVPAMKGLVPHQVWAPQMDMATGLPTRNGDGTYVVEKTGGLTATMVDIVKAVAGQGIYMLHVVDAIEMINMDHTGGMPGIRVPEGLVFAGADPVATDLLCARYMFSNVPLAEAEEAPLRDRAGGHFPQRVPVPKAVDGSIVTTVGYDCPLSRDWSFESAEERGLGRRAYYVVGWDARTRQPIGSIRGHLGTVAGGVFGDLVTSTLYFDAVGMKFAWDMQRTAFAYWEALDQIAGSNYGQQFLDIFDEDGDGVVTYEEYGTRGITGPLLLLGGLGGALAASEVLGYLRGAFTASSTFLKSREKDWNTEGHDLFADFFLPTTAFVAYTLAQMPVDGQDPFVPGLSWGKGKWPSVQFAQYMVTGNRIYGVDFPLGIGVLGLYGVAFRYADATQNDRRYAGPVRAVPNAGAVREYLADLQEGKRRPLDFTVYVPPSWGTVAGSRVPNVEETTDPAKVFTATFAGGADTWGMGRWPAAVREAPSDV